MKRVLLGFAAALAFAAPAQADTYVVNSTADDPGSCATTCTLRQAITSSNASTTVDDTITIPAGTYTTGSALEITDAVTITGAGPNATVIGAAPSSGRVLKLDAAAVSITDVGLQGGSAPGDSGGSLLAEGSTVTLTRVHVTGGSAFTGGGIANLHGTMTINESLIDANQATGIGAEGGGVANIGDGLGAAAMTISNSTIAFNTAPSAGGLTSSGNTGNQLTTQGVTVAKNQASTGTGGVRIAGGSWSPQFTLVSDNFQDGQVVSNCTRGDTGSGGWNVENFAQCGFTQEVDRDNVGDAGLATILDTNGGPTLTMKLLAGSPALSIRTTGCTGIDQRGVARPQGSGCDAGAFESEVTPGPPPTITAPAADTHRNVREVPFSGTAQPGETVNVYLGFTLQQTAEANAQGVWTTEILLPDTDGVYVYEARTPTSSTGATVQITLDRDLPDTTIVTHPTNPTGSPNVTFSYNADEAGTTFACRLLGVPDPMYAACPASAQSYSGLANGEYTFNVRATDRAGNTDDTPATFTFVVNARSISTPTPDTYTRAATLPFSGTASPGENVTVRLGTTTVGTAVTTGEGVWTTNVDLPAADGEYTYRVEFPDATEDVRVFVDRTAPTGTITSGPPAGSVGAVAAFTYSSGDPEATFRCRLIGPGRDDNEEECPAAGRAYADLPAGGYEFRLRTVDRAGNSTTVVFPFTVAAPPQVVVEQPAPTSSPTPTPTPRPTEIPAPQPEVGESVVIRPTAGRVLIQLPGSSQFVELRSIGKIPLGSTIDTRSGRILLRFETEDGKVQSATFYGGLFLVRQVGKILDLKLTEALAACPKKGKASAAQAKKAKKRKLWGDGKGAFRTTGKYSAATVRGTKWLVEDSCAGTLTRVTSGVVAVRAGKKTVLVRSGRRYLAKPR